MKTLVAACAAFVIGVGTAGTASPAVAQTGGATVSGRITDAATTRPLPNVQIQVVGTRLGMMGVEYFGQICSGF